MQKLYVIEQHKKKFCTITVTFNVPNISKVDDYSIEDIIDAMVAWCREHDCGHRIAYDMFKFRNNKELSLFLLKWT